LCLPLSASLFGLALGAFLRRRLHAEKSRSWWRDRALRRMRGGKKFFSVDLMQDAV
jgi:hypothetical protein